MFEKIGQSAEKVVGKVSVSRRGFLGRAAKAAAGLGAALAGLAAFPAEAQSVTGRYCTYACGYPGSSFPVIVTVFHKGDGPCKTNIKSPMGGNSSCWLISGNAVAGTRAKRRR